jgi:hypothetical protein
MKKITITTLLLAIIIFSHAQETQNLLKGFIGFNLSHSVEKFHESKWSEEKSISTNFKPTLGIFITKSIAIGVSYEINSQRNEATNQDDTKLNTNTLRFYSRIQANINESFKFYFDPYFGKTFYKGNDEVEELNEWSTGIDFGLSYFVTENLSLELNMLNASYYKQTIDDSDEYTNGFDMSYNFLKPNIGMRLYF